MKRGRPLVAFTLAPSERETLQSYARRRTSSQAVALRARIVLKCAEGLSIGAVADELGASRATVGKWRARFVGKRLAGLLDEPRVGAPRKLMDREVERLVTKTLEERPKAATHWSLRSMAKAAGMSRSSIHRIWNCLRSSAPPQ